MFYNKNYENIFVWKQHTLEIGRQSLVDRWNNIL